ncbi:hypothetical protein C900_04782 [Fulvivirga imtechensis AK7]|uniref:Uncharacterized protein n=1 Tax=Fulvivirga imtechensis AK7 TaxID=1237149 RepID=L8JW76_9BACT|nr:hypothetical protein [Fulvivirga imtechensis]ELR73271.1 hypothetical protein C900_04782 [Fulvivirga imtechensis AK7]
METFILEKDIKVLYVEATSFPDGIMEAHEKLHDLVPFDINRRYFGISRPENGTIVYKAAAEVTFSGEAEELNCDTMTVKKGRYISSTVRNFKQEPHKIEKAFQKLLMHDNLDLKGYCVEWYMNDEDIVKCMIKLKDI